MPGAAQGERAGAQGYVLKSHTSDVTRAIRTVMSGQPFLSDALSSQVINAFLGLTPSLDETLSHLHPVPRATHACTPDVSSMSVRAAQDLRARTRGLAVSGGGADE